MAGLAARWSAPDASLLHALFELSLMRIIVTVRATQVLPVVDDRWLRLQFGGLLVAISAGHRDVSASEGEVGFFVLRQSEGGGLVAFQSVAAIAGIEVRSGCKLAGMAIVVAIGAAIKLYLEKCVFPLGNVALGAFEPCVATLERVGRGSVLLQGKK